MSSIRTILDLIAVHDLEIEQMNVKTVFLHGDFKKEINMKQPEVFKVKSKENYVFKLKKSFYGL